MIDDTVEISAKKIGVLISVLERAKQFMDRPHSPSGQMIDDVILELMKEREK